MEKAPISNECIETIDCVCDDCIEEIRIEEMREKINKKFDNSKFLLKTLFDNIEKEKCIFNGVPQKVIIDNDIDGILDIFNWLYCISSMELYHLIYDFLGDIHMKKIYDLSDEELKYLM